MKIEEIIISRTKDFIVLNKPSGLLSIPDREGKQTSLKQLLQATYGEIYTVHRLDRDTSGIIVFALNEKAHRHLSIQFEGRETVKIYKGIVIGAPLNVTAIINEPIAEHPNYKGVMRVNRKGKESITEYELLLKFSKYSLLKFRIFTGRTHQIRVHMKHIGHPIACDNTYGDGKPILLSELKRKFKLSKSEEEERPLLNRLALHSSVLEFISISGESHYFEAPLPKDMQATINQLQKWSR
jgi:23S rRNA pseudouridine955/2504/2580 synthase/23S rRNA pseudouridine1911/1915/1917 synthase